MAQNFKKANIKKTKIGKNTPNILLYSHHIKDNIRTNFVEVVIVGPINGKECGIINVN